MGVTRDRCSDKSYGFRSYPLDPVDLCLSFRNVSDNRGGEVYKISHPYHPFMAYLPTFTTKINQIVGKYTIHGRYEFLQKPILKNYAQMVRSFPQVFGFLCKDMSICDTTSLFFTASCSLLG